jgi:hypothetical protein
MVSDVVKDLERCSADTLKQSLPACLAAGGHSIIILEDTGRADSSARRDSSAQN